MTFDRCIGRHHEALETLVVDAALDAPTDSGTRPRRPGRRRDEKYFFGRSPAIGVPGEGRATFRINENSARALRRRVPASGARKHPGETRKAAPQLAFRAF
jgi:hypothetical protein